MKSKFLTLIFLLNGSFAMAQLETGVQQLFIFEKNRNPQNMMVVYTRLDDRCRVITQAANDKNPTFDFYWLMNRQTYKPVAFLIKKEIRNRLKLLSSSDSFSFSILMNDLKEVQTDINNFTLSVHSEALKNKGCTANSFLTLGPSDQNMTIRLQSIYAESKGFFFPKLISITLKGVDVKTGQLVERKYFAKKDS